MKAPEAYLLWLDRRLSDGSDMDRVRRQLLAWAAKPPEGTSAALFTGMLTHIGVKPEPEPTPDAGAFD